MEKAIENGAGDGVSSEAVSVRKPYAPPTLQDFGLLSELTQGTFAGVGADSGIYS